jgi:alanyl-tRNA synthetase
LMHRALREVLGPHVQQKGSLVDAEKTRFDFSHDAAMTDEQVRRIEAMVNAEILRNEATSARIMKFDDAVKGGAMALFGEKYGDEVRVLDIGSSRELCGGTHVARTGDIGFFKITSQGGVAAGVRRVEATTGEGALEWVQAMEDERHFVEGFYQASGDALKEKLKAEREEKRALEKELARLKSRLAASQGDDLAAQAVEVKGIKVLCDRARLDRRGQGEPYRRGDSGPHREAEGGRARQLRGAAGRRQRRRQAGHGAGGRHRARQSPGCARLGAPVGGAAALRMIG